MDMTQHRMYRRARTMAPVQWCRSRPPVTLNLVTPSQPVVHTDDGDMKAPHARQHGALGKSHLEDVQARHALEDPRQPDWENLLSYGEVLEGCFLLDSALADEKERVVELRKQLERKCQEVQQVGRQ